MVAVLEIDPVHGGLTLQKAREQCPERLADALFTERPVEWHREGDFQRISLLLMLHRGFPSIRKHGLCLLGGPLASLETLRLATPDQPPLYCSPYNPGAAELVHELATLPCFENLATLLGKNATRRPPTRRRVAGKLAAKVGLEKRSWSLGQAFGVVQAAEQMLEAMERGTAQMERGAAPRASVVGRGTAPRASVVGRGTAPRASVTAPRASVVDIARKPKGDKSRQAASLLAVREPAAMLEPARFLLYLTDRTFTSDSAAALVDELERALLQGMPILLVHERDLERGGAWNVVLKPAVSPPRCATPA